jgi:IclR family acetate operon transcriptional repressor
MRSVRTALLVFEAVAEHQPAGLSALARELDLPKTTVQRSLAALADSGWIAQDILDPGRWVVSARFAVLADAAPLARAVRVAAQPHLAALRDETGETVGLFTIDGDHMVLLEGIDGTHIVRAVERQVGPLPIHVSAAGRAMLACLPDEARRTVVERLATAGLDRYTKRSIVDVERLLDRIGDATRRGYAIVDGEYVDDLCGVGAAVTDEAGFPVAGVALLAPSHRLKASSANAMGRRVVACTDRISDTLRSPRIDGTASGRHASR